MNHFKTHIQRWLSLSSWEFKDEKDSEIIENAIDIVFFETRYDIHLPKFIY